MEKASFPDHPYSRLDFAYYLLAAREGFTVVEKDAKVVGYVIATRQGREGSIASIAVLPSHRRRGIGRMLMESAMDHLAGKCERVTLLVDVENQEAIRLYHRFSFAETGKIVSKYYPDGHDALEMLRELEPTRLG